MYDLYCKNFLRTYHGENNLTLHQKNTEFFSFRRTRKQGEDLTIWKLYQRIITFMNSAI